MVYSAEISRACPGCFLFLVDQSGSMNDEVGGKPGGKRKADAVTDAINRLIHSIVIKCTKSEGIRDYFEIGVIGYGAKVEALFGDIRQKHLIPVSVIATQPLRIEERVRKIEDADGNTVDQRVRIPIWVDAVANGDTPMCQTLRLAYDVLAPWVDSNPLSYPPVVINISDGDARDGNPEKPAHQVMSLTTHNGNVLLFNCHISSEAAEPVLFPSDEKVLPGRYAQRLFRMSAVLPPHLRQAARYEGFAIAETSRGFAFNADLLGLVRFLDIGTRPSSEQVG